MSSESGPSMIDQLSQVFPPKPSFTEENLPELQGKVDMTHLGAL